MSLFITFEGVEGSGKTTQIRRLKDALKMEGYKILVTREPGGTSIGDQIRSILLDSKNQGMVPLAELLLYAAARSQHVEEVILPALKDGFIVLCDRFMDATLAYQGFGRGFSPELIRDVNQWAIGKHLPDCTFLLDCDSELGLKRAHARIARIEEGPLEDRFEREELIFHRKVRKGYLMIAAQNQERIQVIDASQDPEIVEREIRTRVLQLLEA